MRKHAEWVSGLQEPVCLIADSQGRVYVLDIGQNTVFRFSADGEIDSGFSLALTSPFCIAIDKDDRLYVSEADTILHFDVTGPQATGLGEITAPASRLSPRKPRALAVHDPARLYAADAKSGYIAVFDKSSQIWSWLGQIKSYCGPVAAMALDEHGALLIKPGMEGAIHRLDADVACVESGKLLAGPLDAGEGDAWERVWIEAEIPAETSVILEVAANHDGVTPAEDSYVRSLSHDVLLRTLTDGNEQPLTNARFIWLRITLESHDGRSTPLLQQVQAATAQPSYLDYLPAIYRRDDAATGFLERWLALFRAELGDWDRTTLEELPRRFDARTVNEAEINKLAAWLALELPARIGVPEQRQLLIDAHKLYKLRGTPAGLREMARRILGATIHIFEAFRERRVWQLEGEKGLGLGLGLDTVLPAGTPDGLIVPGYTYADRELSGLRGDYYEGTKFEILRYTHVDKKVEFRWEVDSPLKDVPGQEQFPANNFSVRWSGQVRPRFAETYMFRTESDDGVRLWVGNRLIIDNWTDHPPTVNAGQIRLEAGRWYPIVLEFYEKGGAATITLSWSSISQRSEIVPQECLYSILDETADFAPEVSDGCGLLEVGHAIVGEGRPQAAEDFGAPLADDYAHLFTVMAFAAQVPSEAKRQALRDLIEAEKPAHTDFSLCLIEPRMRVGIQARVGIDSVVAGPGPVMRLGSSALGHESYLGGERALSPAKILEAACETEVQGSNLKENGNVRLQ